MELSGKQRRSECEQSYPGRVANHQSLCTVIHLQSGYNYKYTGIKSRNGKQGFEVILTPENKQDITSITLFVSQTYQPLYIKVEQSNKSANEIIVTSYQTNQPLDNATFKFDKKKFPNAEVIDLR